MLQFVALTGKTKLKKATKHTNKKRCGSCLNDTDKKANNLVWGEEGKGREEQISNKSKKTHDLTFVSYI